MAEALKTPAPPCPECRMRGITGLARIGNRRSKCKTCNQFVQRVLRLTHKLLVEFVTEDEYEKIRVSAELTCYQGVLNNFLASYPEARGNKQEVSGGGQE